MWLVRNGGVVHTSMKEAVSIAKGELQPSRAFTVEPPDVKAVREKTGLSQAMFAAMIGKSKDLTELGATSPDTYRCGGGLLTIFDREPETAMKALHGA